MTLFQIISSKHVTFVALARKNSEVCYLKLKLKILKLRSYLQLATFILGLSI